MGKIFGGLTEQDSALQRGNAAPVIMGQGPALTQAVSELPAGPRLDMETGQAVPAPINPNAARVVTPSFGQASSEGKGLTTKGKILGLLLNAAQGAALGAGQPNFSAGFERASLFPLIQRQRQQQLQQEEQEAQLRQQNIERGPALFDLNREKLKTDIAENKARTGSLLALGSKREKTKADIDREAQEAADASGYTKGSPEYNQIRFGNTLRPPQDNSISPYEDYRKSYPDTPAGRAQAAKDYQLLTRPPKTRAEELDGVKADAEEAAVYWLNRAGGDPNKAMQMLDAHLPRALQGKDKVRAAKIAGFVRDNLRERARINTGSTNNRAYIQNRVPAN